MGFPNDSLQADLYNAAGLHNAFEIDPGVCVLPLAEDPPESVGELATWSPVVILRLHAPYRLRRMIHVADKKNNPPPSPSYGDAGKFVFTGGTLEIRNSLNPTGCNFDWSINCVYTFVEDCVCREQDGYVLGNTVFTWQSDVSNQSQIGASSPNIGAISEAGVDALVGYHQGRLIVQNAELVTGDNPLSQEQLAEPQNQLVGSFVNTWGYNTPSYYPGTMIYSYTLNGGPPLFNA